jgi:lysophospholipase L1-like esterase
LSVQVSYSKQFLVGIIFILFIAFSLEGISKIYDIWYPSGCILLKSDIYKNLDLENKRNVCDDFRQLEFGGWPFYQMSPNQHFETININSHGFRGSDFSSVKPENMYRIFIIGGSTVFGTGSTSDNTTIPGFLQEKFDKEELPKDIEVINTGISGLFSGTEVGLIKQQIIHFDPDLLVVYDGWNDIAKKYENYNDGVNNSQNPSSSKERDTFYEFGELLFDFSVVAKIIYTNLDYLPMSFAGPAVYSFEGTEINEKADIWSKRWIEICELGKINNFDVVVTLQPILGSSERTLSEFEKRQFQWKENERRLPALENYANNLDHIDNYCAKTADFRNVFDGINEPLYLDSVHLGDNGNKIVSEEIYELILPLILEK